MNPYSPPSPVASSQRITIPPELKIPTVRVHLSRRFIAFAVLSSVFSLGLFALLLAYLYRQYLLTIDANGVSTHGKQFYAWSDLTKVERGAGSVAFLRFGKRKVIVLNWAIVERDSLADFLRTLSAIA